MRRKWTKADTKRAEKMGWALHASYLQNEDNPENDLFYEIIRTGQTFKTRREAVEWVMRHAETGIRLDGMVASRHPALVAEKKICRKALMLCALGGEQ